MYWELFFLDNLLMDALLLRFACALCARPCRLRRVLPAALLGAVYAVWTLRFPAAGHGFCKLLCAALMAFAIPGSKSLKAYACALFSLLFAACAVGGLFYALLFAPGASDTAGMGLRATPLRVGLLGACAAAFLPRLWREKRMWRRPLRLCVAYGGVVYTLPARLDTGNSLREPISGLPVIVADLEALREAAEIPIPARTVQGGTVLYALRADMITLDGVPSDALLALSSGRLETALVPPAALAL